MKYRLVNKRGARAIFIATAVLVIVLILSLFDGGRAFLSNIGSPFFFVGTQINDVLRSFENTLKTKGDLRNEIEMLRHEYSKLAYDSLTYHILKAENRELRERLGVLQEESNFTLARVVAKPPVVPFDSLTIETARRNLPPEGGRVRVSETIEIGRVDTWGPLYGIVVLYTSTGVRTPVEINGGGSLVIAEGVGGGSYVLRVPRSFVVEAGDLLTRPGLESVVIGVVEGVEAQEADPFLFVRARLPVNLFEITWVYVEHSKTPPQGSLPWF
jgi:cell shape-determining protein MreC